MALAIRGVATGRIRRWFGPVFQDPGWDDTGRGLPILASPTRRAVDAIKCECAELRVRTAIRAAEYPPSGSPGSSRAGRPDRQDRLQESLAAQLNADVKALKAKHQASRLSEGVGSE